MQTTHEDVCRQCKLLASSLQHIVDVKPLFEPPWLMTIRLNRSDGVKDFYCLGESDDGVQYCPFFDLHTALRAKNIKNAPTKKPLKIKIADQ